MLVEGTMDVIIIIIIHMGEYCKGWKLYKLRVILSV